MAKISVVIPMYNSEIYIKRALESIIQQTYRDYEVVLVDDGSTDCTKQIVAPFLERGFTYIYQENKGPGIARKTGFEKITGELVYFIDSDDFLPSPHVFEIINKLYAEHQFDILVYNYMRLIGSQVDIINTLRHKKLKEGFYDRSFFYHNRLEGGLCQKIFRREYLKAEYFYDHNNFEDFYTTYRYLNHCQNIYVTEEILYCTDRNNSASITKKTDFNKMYKTLDLLEEMYRYSDYKDVVSSIIAGYYTYCRLNIDRLNFSNQEKQKLFNKLKQLEKYIRLSSLITVKRSGDRLIRLLYVRLFGNKGIEQIFKFNKWRRERFRRQEP